MNKFLLISISFLILIIGIGCAAAADLESVTDVPVIGADDIDAPVIGVDALSSDFAGISESTELNMASSSGNIVQMIIYPGYIPKLNDTIGMSYNS